MNNSAAKVGEIFTEAGAAFNKLAEMTIMMHPMAEHNLGSQVKVPIKRKAPEERSINNTPTNIASLQHLHSGAISQQVTLNMLNAPEPEIEVETTASNVKLEFEPTDNSPKI